MDSIRLRRSGFTPWTIALLAVVALCGGCSRNFPATGMTSLKASNPAELQRNLLTRKPDVTQFRLRGPFAVTERTDVELRVPAGATVTADLFLCESAKQAPLVIIVHGQGNSKDDHAFQAMHLASWGMHAMAVQLPNEGPWIANGKTLASLVAAIRRSPQMIDRRIDPDKIILAGHSFGATAVSTALAEGAPALGGILLDPAGIGRQLPALLRQIKAPVVVIGADEDIWPTRNRSYFFRFIPRNVGEVSIRDAVHEDAQYPSNTISRAFKDHPFATEDAQVSFVSALTAAAFGLAATGGIDYAWASYDDSVKNGAFFNARRK